MKILKYEVAINSSRENVWNVMIEPKTYKQWTKAFSPNSEYIGLWEQGEEMIFIDKDRGGTVAILDIVKPYELISATHIATLTAEMLRETKGPMTESWIGTKEIYRFIEKNAQTKIEVEIHTHENYVEMFDSAWPEALRDLKKLCE
ncbi:MAG: hypothetical protein M9962_13070 [Oligoflexia bacterium]|nr:hypothetical protein [Oligoflexia bacterium]